MLTNNKEEGTIISLILNIGNIEISIQEFYSYFYNNINSIFSYNC